MLLLLFITVSLAKDYNYFIPYRRKIPHAQIKNDYDELMNNA